MIRSCFLTTEDDFRDGLAHTENESRVSVEKFMDATQRQLQIQGDLLPLVCKFFRKHFWQYP